MVTRQGVWSGFLGLSSFLEPCNCISVSKIGLCLTDTILNGTQNDF